MDGLNIFLTKKYLIMVILFSKSKSSKLHQKILWLELSIIRNKKLQNHLIVLQMHFAIMELMDINIPMGKYKGQDIVRVKLYK